MPSHSIGQIAEADEVETNEEQQMSQEMLDELAAAVTKGKKDDIGALAKEALEKGLDPLQSITEGLTKGIQKAGELFAEGEFFLPDLIFSAAAMKTAMDVLEPVLVGDQAPKVVGTIVLGTVEGDLHEIGKNLVGTMLTANGFKVIDIGADKPASEFIDAVKDNRANLVGASALLTTSMLRQKDLIEALKDAGLREQVMVLVGGAPVTEKYAKEIGADGYAPDAISAVELATRLVGAPAQQTTS
jgi:5-methyltetrahydrofolate--homocysteine methyltransferase